MSSIEIKSVRGRQHAYSEPNGTAKPVRNDFDIFLIPTATQTEPEQVFQKGTSDRHASKLSCVKVKKRSAAKYFFSGQRSQQPRITGGSTVA
mmetsp:Transcript_12550/g.50995  ORF Transcript_12550/g.50995 Transcript_12550/m.50995 type:complete len:92 (+) Transcript_12550:1417-1692(+)